MDMLETRKVLIFIASTCLCTINNQLAVLFPTMVVAVFQVAGQPITSRSIGYMYT